MTPVELPCEDGGVMQTLEGVETGAAVLPVDSRRETNETLHMWLRHHRPPELLGTAWRG